MRALTGILVLGALVLVPALVAGASGPGSLLQVRSEEGASLVVQDDPVLSPPPSGDSIPAPIFLFKQPSDCPAGTFNCYCNGVWVGCVTTIDFCWNACTAQGAESITFGEQTMSR